MRSKIKYDIIEYDRLHNLMTVSYKDSRYALDYQLKRYDIISEKFEADFIEFNKVVNGAIWRNYLYTASLKLEIEKKACSYA